MLEIRIHSEIEAIGRYAWDGCFAGALEGYDYLLATERAGIAGFRFCYLTAQEKGVVVAAMPGFLTRYALDTTLEGVAKAITTRLRGLFPTALTLKLACLGSPVTEYGLAGFHPRVAETEKSALLAQMLAAFETHALEEGYALVGVKDIPAFHDALWNPVLMAGTYPAMPSLAVASLAIDFANMDAYFARLSSATRKDMRRKLRAGDAVRIEQRTDIRDVLPQMMALYRDTHARADRQFEELTEAFFTGVLETMPGRAFCTLYFVGEALLAFNLHLQNSTTLIDKFFCMDGVRGRPYNLYFVSWFANIRHCLAQGLSTYQSGAAGYENKLRLSSTLTPTRMAFKHRNRVIHRVLRFVAKWLAVDSPSPYRGEVRRGPEQDAGLGTKRLYPSPAGASPATTVIKESSAIKEDAA